MFCHKCGAKLDDGAIFCHKCGEKVVYKDVIQQHVDTVPVNDGHKSTNTLEQIPVESGQEFQQDNEINNIAEDFKTYVDDHIRRTTKFQSVDDLLTNSRPLMFIWPCIGIMSMIGLILGIRNQMGFEGVVTGLLIFGVFFGYVTVYVVSRIIRRKYRRKFSGGFSSNIDSDNLLNFLNEHLHVLSPYFHECGYLKRRGGLLTHIENGVSQVRGENILCCEYGPRKKDLALLYIRPNRTDSESVYTSYVVSASHNGFMLDGRDSEFFAYSCFIKTAPILQAAMEYYLNFYKD